MCQVGFIVCAVGGLLNLYSDFRRTLADKGFDVCWRERHVAIFLPREVLNAQLGLTDDRAQGAAIQFFMVRNNHLGEGVVAAQDNVTAALAHDTEAKPAQNGDAFLAGELGQLAHTATKIASKDSTGTVR